MGRVDQIDERVARVESSLGRLVNNVERLRESREDDPLVRAIHTLDKPFSKVSFSAVARMCPAIVGQFSKRVPSDRFAKPDNDEGVVLECSCEREVHCLYDVAQSCECGRYFVYDGREIRVAGPYS